MAPNRDCAKPPPTQRSSQTALARSRPLAPATMLRPRKAPPSATSPCIGPTPPHTPQSPPQTPMTPPAVLDPSMSTDCLVRGTRTPRDHDRALLPATPLRASAPRPARAALPQPPPHPAPTPRPVTQSASDAAPPCSPRQTSRLPHASTATPHTAQPAPAAPPRLGQTTAAVSGAALSLLPRSPRRSARCC